MPPVRFKFLAASFFASAIIYSNICSGADPKPVDVKKDQQLFLYAFPVPTGFLNGDQSTTPEILNQKLKKFFVEQGVTFPSGSDVTFQSKGINGSLIIARQTADNIDLLTQILMPTDEGGPVTQFEIKLSVYQYPTDAVRDVPKDAPAAFDSLKSAGKSLVLLERVVGLSRSGPESESNHSLDGVKSNVKVGLIMEPDETTIDLNMEYNLDIPNLASSKEQPLNIADKSSFSVKDGIPLVIKSFTIPDHSKPASPARTKTIAIVVEVNAVNIKGTTLRDIIEKHPVVRKK